MRKVALVLILFGCLAGLSFGESNHSLGLGIMLGEPTGISFKVWNRQTMAWDAGAAWSFVSGKYFQIHSDLLLHNFSLFKVETGRMALFYGAGARIKFGSSDTTGDSDTVLSLRVPIGISYEFEKTPVELFLEIVPMLDLIPSTEVQMAGAVGFRYYF
ncbi:MAG: DUF3996 domain-containing protein [Candidatus Aminicenantales bacterium]